jgi:hypothetical protein
MGIAALKPSYRLLRRSGVGWVEQGETHHSGEIPVMPNVLYTTGTGPTMIP